MARTSIVGRQLSLYEEQSESWQRDYVEAEQCKDLEDIIAFGTFVYDRIKHIDAEWSNEMDAAGQVPDEADALAVWNLYANWSRKTEANLKLVGTMEAKGYHVEGVDRYRDAYRDAQLVTSVSIDRFRLSLRHQGEGRTRPLGELRDELRRRADARS